MYLYPPYPVVNNLTTALSMACNHSIITFSIKKYIVNCQTEDEIVFLGNSTKCQEHLSSNFEMMRIEGDRKQKFQIKYAWTYQ